MFSEKEMHRWGSCFFFPHISPKTGKTASATSPVAILAAQHPCTTGQKPGSPCPPRSHRDGQALKAILTQENSGRRAKALEKGPPQRVSRKKQPGTTREARRAVFPKGIWSQQGSEKPQNGQDMLLLNKLWGGSNVLGSLNQIQNHLLPANQAPQPPGKVNGWMGG
mgnify:CR=1 FL=1